MLSIGLVVLVGIAYVLASIKIVSQDERGVIFRLGRLLPEAKGPGIVFVPAAIDRMVRVSMLNEKHELPRQEGLTRDAITMSFQPVITFRVTDPVRAVTAADDYRQQTSILAQTAFKSAIGEMTTDEVVDRAEVIKRMQAILDRGTGSWGVSVAGVALKE